VPFDFQTLHFKRCLFRYKPDLPLALNIHVRRPDEPLPTDEELQPSDAPPTAPLSSNPADLMRELEAVLRRAPQLPPSLVQPSLVVGSGESGSVAVSSSPHGSSGVMEDMMQAAEHSDDDDEQLECTVPPLPLLPPLAGASVPPLDSEVQDLDMLLGSKESDGGAPLRFKPRLHSSPAAPPSPVTSPSPPLPLPSPVTPCEPGTILFERGKTYALIGQNRSGKSTLMQILCKLHSPAAAEDCCIELNGGDFLSMPRMALRDHLSYVAQRPFIFPGTIADNIRVGNSSASNAHVQRAAEMAGIFSLEKPKPLAGAGAGGEPGKKSLVDRTGSMKIVLKPWEQNRLKSFALAAGSWIHDKWMKLHGFDKEEAAEEEEEEIDAAMQPQAVSAAPAAVPQNVEAAASAFPSSASAVPSASSADPTPLHPTLLLETAERGSNLSGGFAQSVALARVFLRTQAQIVILDESMGQMDALKKREVIFPTLFRFVKQHRMTLILISHDVAQVCKLVDHVYVLASGQVVQSGNHAQLMEESTGVYARLVTAAQE
jgi:ABC-type multidrug transport system ATPase subunit